MPSSESSPPPPARPRPAPQPNPRPAEGSPPPPPPTNPPIPLAGADAPDRTVPHGPDPPVATARKADGNRGFEPVAVLVPHQTPPRGHPDILADNQRIELHVPSLATGSPPRGPSAIGEPRGTIIRKICGTVRCERWHATAYSQLSAIIRQIVTTASGAVYVP